MDDFNLKGEEMKELLSDLRRVNKLLGGTATTISGLDHFFHDHDLCENITILDVGCGDGEMLRNCSRWASKRGVKIQLVGVDGNPNILNEARKRSEGFDNLSYRTVDVFSGEDELPEFDIALCTLFLHHFSEEQIIDLLNRLHLKAHAGVIVNDLHRSRWAFGLFRIFSRLILKTKIARHDGLVSIARGFKRKELKNLSNQITGKHRIQWRWAFRYQWLIQK